MRRTQKQTQYIRMTKDRLNPMPPAMRRLMDERDALQAQVAALTAALDFVRYHLANECPCYDSRIIPHIDAALDAAGGTK